MNSDLTQQISKIQKENNSLKENLLKAQQIQRVFSIFKNGF